MVKNPPANARDAGVVPGSETSPTGGNGNPHRSSCLENPMDRAAWWATVHGVTKNWTQLRIINQATTPFVVCVSLFATPWAVACQNPLSMGFLRQENWNRLPFPSPGDLPDPGIKPVYAALADAFLFFFLILFENIYYITKHRYSGKQSDQCNWKVFLFFFKVSHCFHCFPIYLPQSGGTACHDLSFLNVVFFFLII